MSKRSPVAVFLAASALLSLNAMQSEATHTNAHKGEENLERGQLGLSGQEYAFHHKKKKSKHNHDEQKGMGGLKEWTTDQEVDEEGKLDASAKKAAEKAKKDSVCIPIGEGENCW